MVTRFFVGKYKEKFIRDKNSLKNMMISIVFIVWFVVSIVGMIYVSKTGQNKLFLAILGQYFLVFGIIGIGDTISHGKFGFENMHPKG